MKILYYMPNVKLEKTRGDATHTRELAFNLSKLGNELIIITQDYSEFKSEYKNMILKGVKEIPLSGLRRFSSETLGFFRGVIECFRYRPDIIYRREEMFFFSNIFYRLFRIPVVTEINGISNDEILLSEADSRLILLKKIILEKIQPLLLGRRSLDLSRKIVVVTVTLKEVLQQTYGIDEKKLIVIQNGANTDVFRPVDTKRARLKLGLSSDCNYVCFVGRFLPYQGLEYLIQAAPCIVEKLPDTYFLIVGDGRMEKKWKLLAEKLDIVDKFIFTGTVPHDKIPFYINASDVCVAPFIRSRNERIGLSPLKLYEYMACGKPVVASYIKGVGDVLEYENAGIAVTPENPRELSGAIIKLLQNEDLRKQMGANGRKYVVENHSWASVAKKVEEVCEMAIVEHKRDNR